MPSHRDQAGPLVDPRRLARGRDRSHVVSVLDAGRMPAIRVEPLQGPVRECHRRGAVELDVVVVVEVDELAQLQMARQRSGLGRDAFLQVSVRADRVDVVVDQLVAGPVELSRETALCNGHSDAVGESLP